MINGIQTGGAIRTNDDDDAMGFSGWQFLIHSEENIHRIRLTNCRRPDNASI